MKRIWSCVFVIGILCVITLPAALNNTENSVMHAWGNVQKQQLKENTNRSEMIVLRGKTAVITESELQQAIEFYKLTGMSDKESEETAVLYLKKREALYREAVKNGFTVTDQEVRDYLEELKRTLYESDNKEDVFAVIEGFGSEEEYWNYEFSVYRKNLPIQKYVENLQKKLTMQKGRQISQEDWIEYYEQLKNALVEQQNYQEVSDITEVFDKTETSVFLRDIPCQNKKARRVLG